MGFHCNTSSLLSDSALHSGAVWEWVGGCSDLPPWRVCGVDYDFPHALPWLLGHAQTAQKCSGDFHHWSPIFGGEGRLWVLLRWLMFGTFWCIKMQVLTLFICIFPFSPITEWNQIVQFHFNSLSRPAAQHNHWLHVCIFLTGWKPFLFINHMGFVWLCLTKLKFEAADYPVPSHSIRRQHMSLADSSSGSDIICQEIIHPICPLFTE